MKGGFGKQTILNHRICFSSYMIKKTIAALLVAAIVLSMVPGAFAAASFRDVPAGSWFEKAVAWAVEEGITCGTSETTFSPNLLCTRAQVITFIWRQAGSPTVYSTGNLSGVTDIPKNTYYTRAMEWAVSKGILYPNNGKVSPKTVVTRQDICYYTYNAAVPTSRRRANRKSKHMPPTQPPTD